MIMARLVSDKSDQSDKSDKSDKSDRRAIKQEVAANADLSHAGNRTYIKNSIIFPEIAVNVEKLRYITIK